MPGFFDNVGVEKTTNNTIYDQLYTDIAQALATGYGIVLPEITRNDKGEREFYWKVTPNNIPIMINHMLSVMNHVDSVVDALNHRVETLEGIVEHLKQENEFLKEHI